MPFDAGDGGGDGDFHLCPECCLPMQRMRPRAVATFVYGEIEVGKQEYEIRAWVCFDCGVVIVEDPRG